MAPNRTAYESSVRQLERAAWDVEKFLEKETGLTWKHGSSNGDWFSFSAGEKFVSVGIPGWGGYAVGFNVMITFPIMEIRQARDVAEIADLEGKVSCFTKNGRETLFSDKLRVAEFVDPDRSPTLDRLARAIQKEKAEAKTASTSKESPVSDSILRANLIRLAHAHPEFRKDLLPLIASEKAGCGLTEGPMQGKFEEGKPADPTKDMSPEDAKKWHEMNDKHEDKFKNAGSVDVRYPQAGEVSTMSDRTLRAGLIRLAHAHPEFRKDLLPLLASEKEAGCEKLPEALRANCEKKSEGGEEKKDEGDPKGKEAADKTAGMAIVRKVAVIQVRLTQHREIPGGLMVAGIMVIGFGSNPSAPIRFTAEVGMMGDQFVVRSAAPLRPVTGSGADVLLDVLKSALQEAFVQRGSALLGSAADQLVSGPEAVV